MHCTYCGHHTSVSKMPGPVGPVAKTSMGICIWENARTGSFVVLLWKGCGWPYQGKTDSDMGAADVGNCAVVLMVQGEGHVDFAAQVKRDCLLLLLGPWVLEVHQLAIDFHCAPPNRNM
jgi:hypothetical protein